MLKKMLMVGISTLMAFTLGACGNGEPSAEGNTGVESSLENVTESISEAPDGESSESIQLPVRYCSKDSYTP